MSVIQPAGFPDLRQIAAAVVMQRASEVTLADVWEEYGDVLTAHEVEAVHELVARTDLVVQWLPGGLRG